MPDHGARRTERQWAGDALKAKTRKFGVVYPTTEASFDVDAFATLVAKTAAPSATRSDSFPPMPRQDRNSAARWSPLGACCACRRPMITHLDACVNV
jgi:hypothetical protein